MKESDDLMCNGWKSKQQIMNDYGYSESVYNARMNECFASPYREAIISDTSKFSTVDEPRYQDFLKWRTKKKWDKMLGRTRKK